MRNLGKLGKFTDLRVTDPSVLRVDGVVHWVQSGDRRPLWKSDLAAGTIFFFGG